MNKSKMTQLFTVTVNCKPAPIVQRDLSKYGAKEYIRRMETRYQGVRITKTPQNGISK